MEICLVAYIRLFWLSDVVPLSIVNFRYCWSRVVMFFRLLKLLIMMVLVPVTETPRSFASMYQSCAGRNSCAESKCTVHCGKHWSKMLLAHQLPWGNYCHDDEDA